MDSSKRIHKSTLFALIDLFFLACLLMIGLSDSLVYYVIIFVGLIVSTILAIYYSKKERVVDKNSRGIGIWIVAFVMITIAVILLLPLVSW